MLNAQNTKEIVNKFYEECVRFWMREGREAIEARRLAIRDCECLRHDPNVPKGEELDLAAKDEFLEKLRKFELR